MTLEDRLERLATRTPEGDAGDVLAGARRRAEASRGQRSGSPRVLAAAAAVLAVVALGAGALALTDDGTDTLTVAGPDDRSEAASDEAGVTASVEGLPSVEASTSPLRPSGQGWAEHTVTLRNTGSEPARLGDFRGGDVLGDDEVAVAHGCNYSGSGELACLANIQPVTIEAGDAYEFTVTVWRDLAGMNPVTAGPHVWRLDVYPEVAEEADSAAIVVTYRNLDVLALDEPNPTGGLDGPVMYAPASHSDRLEFAQLTGVLGREGDCLFLYPPPNARDLTVETLLWPYGATWEDDPAGVRVADGTFVPVGAQFTAAGGIHDIDGLAGQRHHPDVADRARECDQQSASRENVDVVAYVQGQFEVTGVPDALTEGDAAVWEVDATDPPAPSATSVTALVTRLGCNGGLTGEVLEPEVSADAEQVVVTFSVEPVPGGRCPGNDSVPYVVELGEPLGDRELVDGACLSGDAASTSHCSDGAVRWPAPG